MYDISRVQPTAAAATCGSWVFGGCFVVGGLAQLLSGLAVLFAVGTKHPACLVYTLNLVIS